MVGSGGVYYSGMFEDEIAEIDAMILNPGDICVIMPGTSKKNVKKNICLVIQSQGNNITILKSNVGVIVIPKGWLRKIEVEDDDTSTERW